VSVDRTAIWITCDNPLSTLICRQASDARDVTDSSSILGRTISHYHTIEKVGGGEMGVVYKAGQDRIETQRDELRDWCGPETEHLRDDVVFRHLRWNIAMCILSTVHRRRTSVAVRRPQR
jgi:hypothetical protein